MFTSSHRFLVLAFFVIATMLYSVPVHAETAGTITALTGEADILRAGTATTVPLKLGDTVAVGDIVRTKSNGRADITFVDNSVMQLRPRTRLGVDEYLYNAAEQKRIASLKLYRGRSGFHVKRALYPSTGSKFEMKTRTAVAGVRGTKGFLVLNGDEKIYVTEGSVEVTTPLGSVMVTAGMVAIIIPGQPPVVRPYTKKELDAIEEDAVPLSTPEDFDRRGPSTEPGPTRSLPTTVPIPPSPSKTPDTPGSPQGPLPYNFK